MHHVASQMRSGELFLDTPARKQALARSHRSIDVQRPKSAGLYRQRRKTSNADDVPSLSLLVNMPQNRHWDIGSIRHIREPTSASDDCTPNSAAPSVFELSSADAGDSPNSSVGSPYPQFVAELEDTSPSTAPKSSIILSVTPYVAPLSVTKTKPAEVKESYVEQLNRSEFSKRAAIAIRNITAIETDNRLLLERAIAAEEAAQLLRQKNKSLQHRIDYCANLHRPKTAPGKARAASTGDLTSTFNSTYKTSMQRLPDTPPMLQAPRTPPSGRRRPTPLKIEQAHLSASISPIANPPMTSLSAIGIYNHPQSTPQTPTPSSRRRPSLQTLSQPLVSPRMPQDPHPSPFATIPFPANPHPYRRPRPPPIRTTRSYTRLTDINTPVQGSGNRHTVAYTGVPPSGKRSGPPVSATEARRMEKPLPPMGPMSPSAIPGRVEMGIGYDEFEERRQEEAKKRRGIRVLFRWGKKDCGHSLF